jgi:hypothetical protein
MKASMLCYIKVATRETRIDRLPRIINSTQRPGKQPKIPPAESNAPNHLKIIVASSPLVLFIPLMLQELSFPADLLNCKDAYDGAKDEAFWGYQPTVEGHPK